MCGYFAASQVKDPCEEVLSRSVITDIYSSENLNNFWRNFKDLEKCGLDSLEIFFFGQAPLIASYMIEIASEKGSKDEITYRDLYNKILKAKESKDYQEAYPKLEWAAKLATSIAKIEDWEKDKRILKEIGVSEERIQKLEDIIKNDQYSPTHYHKLITLLDEQEKQYAKELEPEAESKNWLYQSPDDLSYLELLDSARELNKPLLLYFNGYACVNSRKMEGFVLEDPIILNQLKDDFIFVNLHVDDRRILPEEEWFYSQDSTKMNKRVGSKYYNWQIEKFNSNSQPYFVIIQPDGEKLAEQSYTRSPEEFNSFLKTK